MGIPRGHEMRLWVPRWWQGGGGAVGRGLSLLLLPAEGFFRLAVSVRNFLYDAGLRTSRSAPIPIISIGNLTVGGTGKTPVTAWVAAMLRELGYRPAVVVRGYGVDEIEVHREINPDVPVFAAADRIAAVDEAMRSGANCVLLDDGFQHRQLRRQLDIVLVSAERWCDRHRLLPRGPWRESVGALRRADVVLVTRKIASASEAERVVQELRESGLTALLGVIELAAGRVIPFAAAESPGPLVRLRHARVLAVTSLAEPRYFFDQLRQAGALVEEMTFPDHHPFADEDVDEILGRAAGQIVVTTRKEAVKLRGRFPERSGAVFVEQTVEIERGRDELEQVMQRALGG